MDDPDETVRMQLALRLPQRQLLRMREDPHREVRIRVAQRLAVDHLASSAGVAMLSWLLRPSQLRALD